MKRFKVKKGLVVSGDYEGEVTNDCKTQIYIPAWRWILAR